MYTCVLLHASLAHIDHVSQLIELDLIIIIYKYK